MKADDFEQACNQAIVGWLWDGSYNGDYTFPVSLSVNECRFIANRLRHCEGLPLEFPHPTKDSEDED